MAILGVLARLDAASRSRAIAQLERLDGVTPFPVEEQERVGILVEAASLDEAHDRLTTAVERVEGVLAAWPVYAHAEEEFGPAPDRESVPQSFFSQGVGHGSNTP